MPQDRYAPQRSPDHAVILSDALVEEVGALHARIEGLESTFKEIVNEARARLIKASKGAKHMIHAATEEKPPLETLKHLLKSKDILFASDDKSIMISHGANTFHIMADGPTTLRVSYADIIKEHLSPKDVMDVVQGRRLAAIFAPPMPVSTAAPPSVRLVPSGALLKYSAAIMQQQRAR